MANSCLHATIEDKIQQVQANAFLSVNFEHFVNGRRQNCRVGCNCILALKAFLQTIRKLLYHLPIKSMYALSDCKFVFLNVTGFRYIIHTYLKQVNKFSLHISFSPNTSIFIWRFYTQFRCQTLRFPSTELSSSR